MTATVRLKDIADALEMQMEESSSYLDLDSGQVKFIDDYLLRKAEEFDQGDKAPDLPEWQKPDWEIAGRIVSTDRFVHLPTKYDIHEWEIMNEFSSEFPNGLIRQELRDAIHGAGAFRNFKSAIRRHHVDSAWNDFREKALRQIALDWCEEHHIPWE